MNNIVKSVVFAAVVLFAGIAAMQVIYKNQDKTADVSAVEPAAGEAAGAADAPATGVSDSYQPASESMTSDQADAQKDTIDANADAAKKAVDANEKAAKDAADMNKDAAKDAKKEAGKEADMKKDAIEKDEKAAKDAVDAKKEAADKAAE